MKTKDLNWNIIDENGKLIPLTRKQKLIVMKYLISELKHGREIHFIE